MGASDPICGAHRERRMGSTRAWGGGLALQEARTAPVDGHLSMGSHLRSPTPLRHETSPSRRSSNQWNQRAGHGDVCAGLHGAFALGGVAHGAGLPGKTGPPMACGPAGSREDGNPIPAFIPRIAPQCREARSSAGKWTPSAYQTQRTTRKPRYWLLKLGGLVPRVAERQLVVNSLQQPPRWTL